jgi:myo-inositol-1(or 4)-monophosphatase
VKPSAWLELCRAAGDAAAAALDAVPLAARGRRLERGEGGDVTMTLDSVTEAAAIATLEAAAIPMTVISEERGVVELGGGGPPLAVIDPVDGSLNAKRGLPFHAFSIAIADGPSMDDVEVAYILDFFCGEQWHALRGGGAWLDGVRLDRLAPADRLEIVGLETARPELVAQTGMLQSDRVRALGSVALSMCLVAAGRLDGMLSLRPVRSVDAAAAQLIVREAGGLVAFPDAADQVGLDMEMRSRVMAAPDSDSLATLMGVGADAFGGP